jgi:Kef-type K+ transport system membrane component KefB
MVALELWSILALVLGSAFLKGSSGGYFGITLLAIVATLFLIAQYGSKQVPVFEWIITRATHWRVHLLVLLILFVCMIGERIGLGGPKTAFFLGLALNHTRHRGMNLDEYMAPISQRFLIPIFFVALGLQIRWLEIVSLTWVMAFGTAGLLLGVRMILHNRVLKIGGDKNTFLLLSPNLTMVALGATALLQYAHADKAATWLLLTGLFMTIPSILMLPAANIEDPTLHKTKRPENSPKIGPQGIVAPGPQARSDRNNSPDAPPQPSTG